MFSVYGLGHTAGEGEVGRGGDSGQAAKVAAGGGAQGRAAQSAPA